MSRIDEIIEHEQAAEKCDAAIEDARREADEHRWEAARLICEEAEYRGHGGLTSIAAEIHKHHSHVRKMKLCGENQLRLKSQFKSFNAAYNSVAGMAAEKNAPKRPPARRPSTKKEPTYTRPDLVADMRDAVKTGAPAAAVARKHGVPQSTADQAYIFARGQLDGEAKQRSRSSWDGKANSTRQREIRELKQRNLQLARLLHEMSRLCSVIEDIRVEDFDLEGLGPWDVAMVHDDLVRLGAWHDRLLSAVQGWLEDGDVRDKIATLRDTSGRTPAETETALRIADKLERKLNARLT